MTLPWAEIQKTPLDSLVDIIAKVTGILEDLELQMTASAEFIAQLHLRTRCYSLVTELESWYDAMIHQLDVDRLLNIGKGPSSSTDLSKAHILALFWAICLFLRPTILAILPDMQSSQRFHLHALRYNILRLFSIFFSHGAGWYGVNIALFPIRTIYDTLGEQPLSPREGKLMASLNAEYKGKEIAGFLHSMEHYRSIYARKRT